MQVRDLARGLVLGPLLAAILIVSAGTPATAAPGGNRPPFPPVFPTELPYPEYIPPVERAPDPPPVVDVPAPVREVPVREAPVFHAPAPPVERAPAPVPKVEVPVIEAPAPVKPAPVVENKPAPVVENVQPKLPARVDLTPAVVDQAPAKPAVVNVQPKLPAGVDLAPAIVGPTRVNPSAALVNVQPNLPAVVDAAPAISFSKPAVVNQATAIVDQAAAIVNRATTAPRAAPTLPDLFTARPAVVNYGPRLPSVFEKEPFAPDYRKSYDHQDRKYYDRDKYYDSDWYYDSDCWRGYVEIYGKCVPKSASYDSWYDGCNYHYWNSHKGWYDKGWYDKGKHCYPHPRQHPDVYVVYWDGCGCYLVTYIAPSGYWCVGYYKTVYIDVDIYVNAFINVGYYPAYVQTPAQVQVAQQTGQLILQTPPAEIVGGQDPVAPGLSGSTFATAHGPLPPAALDSLLGRGVAGFGVLMLVALVAAASGRKARQRLRA